MNPNIYNPSTNYAQNYQTATNQVAQDKSNLSNYTGSIKNYGDVYGQDLSSAEQRYGFNPADLQKAQNALAMTNTTMANLPDAIRAQAGGYGITAGAAANNYAQQAGNLANILTGQSNAVNAYNASRQASQDLANAQAGFTVQSEKQKQDALTQILQAALTGQTNAQQQQQGAGSYQTGIMQAQAQQANAAANSRLAAAQAAQAQAQANYINNQQNSILDFLKQYGVSGTDATNLVNSIKNGTYSSINNGVQNTNNPFNLQPQNSVANIMSWKIPGVSR